MKRNILITGGAGFIGGHLARELRSFGHNVTIYDNLSEQIHGKHVSLDHLEGCSFIKGDVRDKDKLRQALDGVDVVYHLAAETGTGQSMYEISRYVDVNEIGTAVLLELLTEIPEKKIDLVLTSSRSIYGEGAYIDESGNKIFPKTRSRSQLAAQCWDFSSDSEKPLIPVPTAENSKPSPGSIYAATKFAQEMLLSVASTSNDNLRVTVLRLQNVYGVGQSLRNPYTGIISIFYNRIRQGLTINIFEDGNESRDFVYVSDVVDALVSTIDRQDGELLIANIGSGMPTTVLELAKLLTEVSGLDAELVVSGDYRVGDIRHCFADLSLAENTLGYVNKVKLKDGLEMFCQWASAQPEYIDKSDEALNELKSKGLSRKKSI